MSPRFVGEARAFGALNTIAELDAADVADAILDALYMREVDAPRPALDRQADSIPLEAFQKIAVAACRASLARWGGVMLCDDVGLGKTYVALELARETLSHGLPVLIVLPSALRAQWIPLVRKHAPAARVLTHSQLSRGSYPAALLEDGGLVIIDEAHAFRSPRARRYRAAAVLARTRLVCLITATPVNNSLWDLYHLVRLFANDAAFAAIGVPDLHSLFDETVNAASQVPRFRRLLHLIMVRRSRADIRVQESLRPGHLRFPFLAPPRAITYQPDDGDGSHRRILDEIAELRLSAIDGSSSGLLRFLLLKRLASSPPAFRSTVSRLLRFHRDFVVAADDGLLLFPQDFERSAGSGCGRSSEQLSMNRLMLRELRPGEPIAALRDTAVRDVALLNGMLRALDPSSRTDDKLQHLRHLLLGPLRERKVLVFTEFRETATYLWRELVAAGGVGLVHGGDAFLGSARAGRQAVIERFARAHNARRAFPLRERVRVLIATDVLSEGLNLQDCAHVVSYDLPWNPVRLIQRIGRIDRLGSPHDRVYTYNFLPDQHLEDYLRILGRLRIKLHAIGMSLGLEHPILADRQDGDGVLNDWDHLRGLCAEHVTTSRSNDELSEADLLSWRRLRPGRADALPIHRPGARTGSRTVPVAVASLPGILTQSVCFIVRRDTAVWAVLCPPMAQMEEISPGFAVAACIQASRDCAPRAGIEFQLIEKVIPHVQHFLKSSASPALRSASLARSGGARGIRSGASAATVRIARRLHNAVASVPGGPTVADLGAVERALDRLSKPLSTAALVDLDRLTRLDRGSLNLHGILTTLEGVFTLEQPDSGRPSPRRTRSEPFKIVAVIVTPSVLYADDNVPLIRR